MSDWRDNYCRFGSKCTEYWKENVESLADVVFIVGSEEEVKAFKTLLCIASPVFQAMFSKTWTTARGQDGPIKLPHDDPAVFCQFLQIMCKDDDKMEQDLVRLSMKLVVGIYLMAKKYLVNGLKRKCEKLMRQNMRVDNVLKICMGISGKDEAKLEKETFDFLILNLEVVLKQPNFLTISKEFLLSILAKNDLYTDELELFTAVCRWGSCRIVKETESVSFEDDENKRRMMRECLSEIRLPIRREKWKI